MDDLNTITYHFEDGTKQLSQVNKAVYFDDKGRRRSMDQIHKVFRDTMHDLGATSYEL